jgi:hypothetical protein
MDLIGLGFYVKLINKNPEWCTQFNEFYKNVIRDDFPSSVTRAKPSATGM